MRLYLSLFLVILSRLCTTAQPHPIPGEGKFRILSTNDGLAQAAVSDIIQDRKGFVWMATRDGLSRYDGQSFTNFRKTRGDTTSLNDNSVWRILEDKEGDIWVGTDYGIACYRYRTDNFDQFIPIPGESFHDKNTVNALAWNHEGNLLVGTGGGVILFDIKKKTFLHDVFPETTGAFVHSILQLSDGTLFIATGKGLFEYNRHYQFEFLHLANPDVLGTLIHSNTYGLAEDQNGQLWVSTVGALHLYHQRSHSFSIFPVQLDSVGNNEIFDISFDEEGTLWLAARMVLSFKDGAFHEYYAHVPNNPNSLSQNLAHCLTFGNDGVMWVGTNGYGISILAPRAYPINHIKQESKRAFGLSSNYVSSILELDDGTVLVGTGGSLDHFSLENQQPLGKYLIYNSTQQRYTGIGKILPDQSPNRYWLGTSEGLALFNLANGTYTRPLSPRIRGKINDLLWLSEKELLIAARRGLFYWNAETDSIVDYNEKLAQGGKFKNYQVQSLLRLGSQIWIGTLQGLKVLDWETHTVKQYLYDPGNPNSIPSNTIKSVYQDQQETIWVSTWGGGLARYFPEEDQFITYDTKSGLPNNVVYGMLETQDTVFWLGTNGGIVRFDPYSKTNTRIFTFSEEDGAQSNEFNTGAFHKGKSGTFYLGGINGLNWFRPEEIVIDQTPPSTVITEFYLDNLLVEPGPDSPTPRHILEIDTLRLRWNQNNLAFRVAALDYTSRKENQFRYKLEGYDDRWQSQDNNFIKYTSLEPGRYRLIVQAASAAGYWDEQGKELVIYLRPPLWKYPAFQIVAVFLGVLLLIGAYFFRLRRLKQGNRKLERIVDDRTRDLQEQQEELATAHEELEQQNEELRLTSDDLENRNQELREQGMQLSQLKNNLENLVEERTIELMKANQELAQQNSQLEQFAFITAHNLKAPISQFQGLLSILPPEHTFDDYTREVHDRMLRSADELKEVVDDLNLILDIKKGMGREFTPVNLIEHINKVEASLRPQANQNRITIQLPKEKKLFILGFSPYVHSIVHNLLHNAVKYSSNERNSWIKVGLSLGENIVELIVEDNGIGIDLDNARDKIFRLYQRFNTTHPGKGFGLFLVKTQVEAMGGNVSINSTLNQGTSVHVQFVRMPEEEGH
ncbi:MAG TPA: hypothetical protein DCE41_16020 [Cytophagales bacterium]|nr:hypothetical protein [Cytophagales bacterium]HAA20513.1 hypothetical protein [Cytophagales bacterium]HAP61567.1 hypothetical protein [Cytophagales bacterium]